MFSCSSGGGGGGGGGGGSSTSLTASDYETTEYNNQYGLASINASTAYVDGKMGDNIIVAVIDSGVDSDHPDLDAQMASGGYDYYFTDSDPNPISQGSSMSHGTVVAGIIAAEKNGTGMHGIAYNASILAIRVFNSAGTPASDAKFRSAIDRAIDQGAKVINASYGSSSMSVATANKWLSAHNNDIISVHAAGNDGEDNPDYGAKLPTESGYEDLADTQIAVVAVDSDNDIASWSNKCGNSKNWCLAAPGVDIYSTVHTNDNNDSNGDGYETSNGTSFAAPHVAGAVAVLRSKWPSKTASQITTILYDTATDLGDSGTDAVYGRGLLNLGSAISPSGLLKVETANGSEYAVSANAIQLNSIFGNSINKKFNIAVLDKYRRDYFISSDSLVSFQTKTFENEFDDFFYEKEKHSTPSYFGKITFDQAYNSNEQKFNISSYKLENSLESLHLTITYDYSPETAKINFSNQFKSLDRTIHKNNFLSMMNNVFTMNVSKNIYDSKISFGLMKGNLNKDNNQNLNGVSIGFITSPFSKLSLGSQLDVFEEKNTFLAAKLNGAMQTNSSMTNSLNFKLKLNVVNNTNFIANYTSNITSVKTSENSLIYSFSDIKSNGYSIALSSKNIFYENDNYSLSYIQPLRVNNGYMFLNMPSGLNLDDTMNFQKKSINLNPSGKEINIKSKYSINFNQHIKLNSVLTFTRENNNNNNTKPIWEGLIKLKSNF